jgi:hypothetical protein
MEDAHAADPRPAREGAEQPVQRADPSPTGPIGPRAQV